MGKPTGAARGNAGFAHLAGDCSASRRDSAAAEDFRSEWAASERNEPGKPLDG